MPAAAMARLRPAFRRPPGAADPVRPHITDRHLTSPAREPGRRDLDHVAPPLRDPGVETRHGPPRRPEPGRRPLASPGAPAPRDTPLESPQPPHVREPDRVNLIPGRAGHRHLRARVDPDNPDVRGRPPPPVQLADDARVPATPDVPDHPRRQDPGRRISLRPVQPHRPEAAGDTDRPVGHPKRLIVQVEPRRRRGPMRPRPADPAVTALQRVPPPPVRDLHICHCLVARQRREHAAVRRGPQVGRELPQTPDPREQADDEAPGRTRAAVHHRNLEQDLAGRWVHHPRRRVAILPLPLRERPVPRLAVGVRHRLEGAAPGQLSAGEPAFQ